MRNISSLCASFFALISMPEAFARQTLEFKVRATNFDATCTLHQDTKRQVCSGRRSPDGYRDCETSGEEAQVKLSLDATFEDQAGKAFTLNSILEFADNELGKCEAVRSRFEAFMASTNDLQAAHVIRPATTVKVTREVCGPVSHRTGDRLCRFVEETKSVLSSERFEVKLLDGKAFLIHE